MSKDSTTWGGVERAKDFPPFPELHLNRFLSADASYRQHDNLGDGGRNRMIRRFDEPFEQFSYNSSESVI